MSKQVYGDPVSSIGSYSAEPSSVGSSFSSETSSYLNYEYLNGIKRPTEEARHKLCDLFESFTKDAQKREHEFTNKEIDEDIKMVRQQMLAEK